MRLFLFYFYHFKRNDNTTLVSRWDVASWLITLLLSLRRRIIDRERWRLQSETNDTHFYNIVTRMLRLSSKSLAPIWHREPSSSWQIFTARVKENSVVARNCIRVSGKSFRRYIARHDRSEAESFSTLRSAAATGAPATLALVQHTLGRRSATSRTKSRVWRTRHATAEQSNCKSKPSCQQRSVIFSFVSWSSSITLRSESCAFYS